MPKSWSITRSHLRLWTHFSCHKISIVKFRPQPAFQAADAKILSIVKPHPQQTYNYYLLLPTQIGGGAGDADPRLQRGEGGGDRNIPMRPHMSASSAPPLLRKEGRYDQARACEARLIDQGHLSLPTIATCYVDRGPHDKIAIVVADRHSDRAQPIHGQPSFQRGARTCARGPTCDGLRSGRGTSVTAAVDQIAVIAADLDRLDRQHAGELSDLVERQACERAAIVARLRQAGAPASPAPEPKPGRRYRPVPPEEEDWRYVEHAAADLGVSRSTCWRWAWAHEAQWPHGDAQRVDFNKIRHLRPPREKNGK